MSKNVLSKKISKEQCLPRTAFIYSYVEFILKLIHQRWGHCWDKHKWNWINFTISKSECEMVLSASLFTRT